jgi:hypothetical protein
MPTTKHKQSSIVIASNKTHHLVSLASIFHRYEKLRVIVDGHDFTRLTLLMGIQSKLSGQCVYYGNCIKEPISSTPGATTCILNRSNGLGLDQCRLNVIYDFVEFLIEVMHNCLSFRRPFGTVWRLVCRGGNPLTLPIVSPWGRQLGFGEVDYGRCEVQVDACNVVVVQTFRGGPCASMSIPTSCSCPSKDVVQ